MAEISIVIPVYHNEENIPDLTAALERCAPTSEFEFVFVDDGSRDGSWRLLETYAAREPRARLVKLSRNFGSFTACVAGLAHARGRAAILMSADLQDPPELIGPMVSRWKEGYEVVLAVRERREEPFLQRLLSSVYYRVMRRWAFEDMPLGGFDFVLIDRKVIDAIVAMQEKNTTLMGLVLWTGFRRTSIPYTRRAREKGRSMWTLRKKVKYFIDSLVSFSYFPIRVAQVLGILFALAGFVHASVVVFLRLRGGIPVPGWSALMVVVLVLGGLQFLMLGVMGEYLWRTLDEAKRRPLFIVDRVIEGGKESEGRLEQAGRS
jgi:glycosyltransferase involved in cell wall biosynthesis